MIVLLHQLRHKNPDLARQIDALIAEQKVDPANVRYFDVEPGATWYHDERMNALCAYIETDEWVGWQLSLGNYDVMTQGNRDQIRRLQTKSEPQPEPTGIAAGILNKLQQHS